MIREILHKTICCHQDFGGDRNSVTVLGHGTGAACLHYLMTSDALPHGDYDDDDDNDDDDGDYLDAVYTFYCND